MFTITRAQSLPSPAPVVAVPVDARFATEDAN